MTTATAEHAQSADRFGGSASIHVAAPDAPALVERGLRLLAEHDRRLSRFRPDSDLSRLNRDPERRVTTTSLVTDLAVAAIEAGRMTGGLVDATVLPAVRRAGYEHHLDAAALDSAEPADFRTDARPATPGFGWREIRVLPHLKTIVRPPGVEIDSGGLAKGMAADVVARTLEGTSSYCVECAGDLVVGGTAGLEREVSIPTPFTESDPEILLVSNGAVATSGITRRSWRAPGGRLAHHLIDPGRGEPAFTGVLQATSLAPTGFEAEVRAKAALLAGADAASEYLPHGGILMLDSGEIVRLDEGASP
jgi:thiamine biosynthesis lipoprotein